MSTSISLSEDGYNPFASEMSNDDLQKWLSTQLGDDIRQVPGIDYKNANLLSISSAAGDGITTSHQLLGVFLLCKGLGVQSEENCSRFYSWLKAKGVTNHISTVVKACAEKCNQYFPGVYDGHLSLHFAVFVL
jgi:hypothetical protein